MYPYSRMEKQIACDRKQRKHRKQGALHGNKTETLGNKAHHAATKTPISHHPRHKSGKRTGDLSPTVDTPARFTIPGNTTAQRAPHAPETAR